MSMPDLQHPATTASRTGQTSYDIYKRVTLFSAFILWHTTNDQNLKEN